MSDTSLKDHRVSEGELRDDFERGTFEFKQLNVHKSAPILRPPPDDETDTNTSFLPTFIPPRSHKPIPYL